MTHTVGSCSRGTRSLLHTPFITHPHATMSLAVSQFASVRISAKPVARRNAPARMTVRAAGGGGKGGEEGGRAFGNDAFGMVAKNANYGLFAAAITKVSSLAHPINRPAHSLPHASIAAPP